MAVTVVASGGAGGSGGGSGSGSDGSSRGSPVLSAPRACATVARRDWPLPPPPHPRVAATRRGRCRPPRRVARPLRPLRPSARFPPSASPPPRLPFLPPPTLHSVAHPTCHRFPLPASPPRPPGMTATVRPTRERSTRGEGVTACHCHPAAAATATAATPVSTAMAPHHRPPVCASTTPAGCGGAPSPLQYWLPRDDHFPSPLTHSRCERRGKGGGWCLIGVSFGKFIPVVGGDGDEEAGPPPLSPRGVGGHRRAALSAPCVVACHVSAPSTRAA